jgi:hypothetical protein
MLFGQPVTLQEYTFLNVSIIDPPQVVEACIIRLIITKNEKIHNDSCQVKVCFCGVLS